MAEQPARRDEERESLLDRQVREFAAEVAADYPPLTAQQKARLSVLLRPAQEDAA